MCCDLMMVKIAFSQFHQEFVSISVLVIITATNVMLLHFAFEITVEHV
jgi:hypothetical protein